MEAVHADWKEYLNLLICEENHLKHMDEYNKVSTDKHSQKRKHIFNQREKLTSVSVCVCAVPQGGS